MSKNGEQRKQGIAKRFVTKGDRALTRVSSGGLGAVVGAIIGGVVGHPVLGAGLGAVCGDEIGKDIIRDDEKQKRRNGS